jgi:hypothetical protein
MWRGRGTKDGSVRKMEAGDLLTWPLSRVLASPKTHFNLSASSPQWLPILRRASLQLAWPSPHFAHLPPAPYPWLLPVRAAESLKGVGLCLDSVCPTSAHLCEERSASRLSSLPLGATSCLWNHLHQADRFAAYCCPSCAAENCSGVAACPPWLLVISHDI